MRTTSATKSIATFIVATLLLASIIFGISKARSVFSNRASASVVAGDPPQLILWAWERPTDLSFINTNAIGVAFLARTIHLRTDQLATRPRLQPLSLPRGTRIIAVARVESDSEKKPVLSDEQRNRLVAEISELATLPNISDVQIDFDASRSERDFYRQVILDLRRRLPPAVGLSITALASWCTYDDWISDLPIDEAVPMLFRMGPDRQAIRTRIAAGAEFPAAPCRRSYGVSTDEPLLGLSRSKHLYVFNPRPWTEDSVHAILESRR